MLSSGTVDVSGLVSEVDLPNSTSFKFKYDQYGHVARVELPTGGAYEYDYTPILESSAQGGGYSGGYAFSIQSQISQKRVYKNLNDTQPEQVMTYSYGAATYQSRSVPATTITYADGSKEVHTFAAFPSTSPTLSGLCYNAWPEGREVRIECYDTNGTTKWRTEEKTLQQRDCSTGIPCWFTLASPQCFDNCVTGVSSLSAPSHDPQVVDKTTTLDSNEVMREAYAYDSFNNRTDVWEYGYGTGAFGSLVRHKKYHV